MSASRSWSDQSAPRQPRETRSSVSPRPAVDAILEGSKGPENLRPRTHEDALRLQRAAGNKAAGSACLPIQRLTLWDANQAVVVRHALADQTWFNNVLVPALSAIAAKNGHDINAYLSGISETDLVKTATELRSEFKSESSWKESFSFTTTLVDSEIYSRQWRISGTDVYVDSRQNRKEITDDLSAFIKEYKSGRMRWYRGLSVSHFSWDVLQMYGVVASEGTRDYPDFTMGSTNPTRWLPGETHRDLPLGVASTVPRTETGLNALTANEELPIAALVSFPVAPPAPVGYLNPGEQVIRGPIGPTNVLVDTVIIVGPHGHRYKVLNAAPTALPPQAPYGADSSSPALAVWLAAARRWMVAHG